MTPVDRIPYRQWFPWLRLSQAIGLSLSVRQLVVAVAAICFVWIGHAAIGRLGPDEAAPELVDILWDSRIPRDTQSLGSVFPPKELARPWDDVVRPGVMLWQPNLPVQHRLRLACRMVWSIGVWTVFGLALCRLAGRRFSRDEQDSVRKSIRFGVKRWWKGIVSPLIPGAAALLIMLFVYVIVLTGRIPGIGLILAALVSPLLLICCLAAAWLMIAIVLGWPLMLAAIAMDDCDGFGGLSRSYGLWTGRPWYYVWCVIVSAVVGTIAVCLGGELANWVLQLAGAAIHWGLGGLDALGLAGALSQFLAALALEAYCISFFWICVTITYALLRQNVDSIPLDMIAPDEQPVRDPFPVAGIPAIHQPTE